MLAGATIGPVLWVHCRATSRRDPRAAALTGCRERLAAIRYEPADVIAQWEDAAQDMMKTAAFRELMVKLKSTASYQGHRDFSATLISVQREMARLIPALGFKRNP